MRTGFNILLMITGRGIPIVLALFTVPIYLQVIGEERYGVLTLIWVFLGYFGLLDLGIGAAIVQRIATLKENAHLKRETFWTTTFLTLALGILGGILLYLFMNYAFEKIANIEKVLLHEVLDSSIFISLLLFVSLMISTFRSFLQGEERFLSLSLVDILDSALSMLVTLLAAILISPTLPYLVAASLVGRVFIMLVLLFFILRSAEDLHLVKSFSLREASHVFRFGGWVTITGIIGPLMVSLDRLLIGHFIGTRSVTHYVVPLQLINRFQIVSSALSSVLFPRLSYESHSGSRKLSVDAMRALIAFNTPIFMLFIFFIHPFLSWWISVDFAHHAAFPAQILAFGVWVNALAIIPFTLLRAKGRPDMVAKIHLLELPPYLFLLFVLIRSWGLEGAAFAFSLRTFADYMLLAWKAGILSDGFRWLLPATILVSMSMVVANMSSVNTPLWGISVTAIVVGAVMLVIRVAPAPLISFVKSMMSWKWLHK